MSPTLDGHIAVVGCGYWGKNLVRNFAQLRALRCISDTNAVALKAQAKLYPDVRLSSEFREVLEDARSRA